MVNIFGNTRHIIEIDTPENLVSMFREYIPPNKTIGIHCTLEDLYKFQNPIKENFTNKFLYTKVFVQDEENPDDRALIIEETHCRAHRGLDENYKQINRLYYWPVTDYLSSSADVCNFSPGSSIRASYDQIFSYL